jgi:hypothetical protein
MLSQLPKLLRRGFLLGFVLPLTVYYLLIIAVATTQGLTGVVSWKDMVNPEMMTPSIIAILFASILLLALNRSIMRLLEGYPIANFFRWLGKHQPNGSLSKMYFRHRSKMFERHVKPVLEEMERVEIQAWYRLELILPQSTLDRLQDSRMLLDFFVNTLALSVMVAGLFVFWSCSPGHVQVLWWLAVPVGVFHFAYLQLPRTAIQWGMSVKSVFDLYRGALAKEMGLTIPLDPIDERRMWTRVSQMMTFRRSRRFDSLAPFRLRTPPVRESKADSKDKSLVKTD